MEVRDLEFPLILLAIAFLGAVSAWDAHVQRVDCRESGGIWNAGEACERNVCRERGAEPRRDTP